MRRYRPFLIYNPNRGWAFYVNRASSSLTHKNIGGSRKILRRIVGWFTSAPLAAHFEKRKGGTV